MIDRQIILKLLVGMMLLTLSGCSFVPREGPLAVEIVDQGVKNDFVIVEVNAEVVNVLSSFGLGGLKSRFSGSGSPPTRQVIGIADELRITIYEADKGGLFSGDLGNRATFSNVLVDSNGQISIPYAGLIDVQGLRPVEVQYAIIEKLADKAIQPQAIVTIVKNETNTVTVSGDVKKPGLYPLSLRKRHLLDVVAAAGGTQFPARETYIRLVRNGRSGVQLLRVVIENPSENIAVRNGDRIYLSHNPQRYTVLGAVTKPNVYKFDATRVSLLEAVANAGGLLDARADSTGLFVFRHESTLLLDALGVTYSQTIGNRVPTIYRVNMQHAKSYFYAQSISLQDKDSIYVANAKSVEVSKIMKLLATATKMGKDVVFLNNNL